MNAPVGWTTPLQVGWALLSAPAAPPGQAQPGGIRSYEITGSQVTLQVTATRCRLLAAAPGPGDSAQSWSSMGWLRVDVNRNGAKVSSLVCDWYQQAPTVTVGS